MSEDNNELTVLKNAPKRFKLNNSRLIEKLSQSTSTNAFIMPVTTSSAKLSKFVEIVSNPPLNTSNRAVTIVTALVISPLIILLQGAFNIAVTRVLPSVVHLAGFTLPTAVPIPVNKSPINLTNFDI